VLLVALTGYGQEGDRRRALMAGFDEHLTKPTRFDTLQRVLAEGGGRRDGVVPLFRTGRSSPVAGFEQVVDRAPKEWLPLIRRRKEVKPCPPASIHTGTIVRFGPGFSCGITGGKGESTGPQPPARTTIKN
jgi:hypothetical protein